MKTINSILKIIIPLLFLAGATWAIIYYVYPYMQKNTSNPVLYTSLLIAGIILLQYIFSREDKSLVGMFFSTGLLRIIMGN